MRISVVRSSGFAEARRSAVVDDVQLPANLRPALDALAELGLTQGRIRKGPVLRSQPHYVITLQGEQPPVLLTLYESQIPALLRPLFDEIMRYAE